MPTDVVLASELRTTLMRLARRLRQQRPETSLTLTQLSVLGTLSRRGSMAPGELAAHERVQPPSMTRTVAALETAGYVTRQPHASDRRQVVVVLTDAGRELVKEDRRRRDAWLAQRMRDLSPEDLDVLRRASQVLERLASE